MQYFVKEIVRSCLFTVAYIGIDVYGLCVGILGMSLLQQCGIDRSPAIALGIGIAIAVTVFGNIMLADVVFGDDD